MSVGTARVEESREDWLSDLYMAHAGAVRAYCQRFLNSPDDAADATHEVFVRAIGSLQAPAPSPQARRWLITVAQNYCLDLMRRRRRMQSALTVLASDSEPQQESEADVMNRRLLDAVLQQLGPRERQALWQSAIEHRSVSEIATSLGISYMAAAQVLHRARKHATAVAAKLGAILGLAGANAIRRRRDLGLIQTLAAMAVIPLVIAVSTPSSSAHAAGAARARSTVHTNALHSSPAGTQVANANPIDTATADRTEHRLRLLPQRLGMQVHSLLGTVTQTVDQLTGQASVPSTTAAIPTPGALPVPSVLPTPLPTPPPIP